MDKKEYKTKTRDSKKTQIDFQSIFESLSELYMILDLDFNIIDISDAYANATLIKREKVVGHNIFEIFSDNPNDKNADGVKQLRLSLMQVLNHKLLCLKKFQYSKYY